MADACSTAIGPNGRTARGRTSCWSNVGDRQGPRSDAGQLRLAAVPARRPAAVRLLARQRPSWCFVSNHDKQPETSTNNDLWIVVARTAEREAAQHHGVQSGVRRNPEVFARRPVHRATGCRSRPGYESDLFRLAVYDRATGQSRVLTEAFQNWIDDFDWATDSRSIYFPAPVEGINPIYRLDVASGNDRRHVFARQDDRRVCARARRQARSSTSRRSVGEPPEIYRADIADGSASRQKLSHFNDAVVDRSRHPAGGDDMGRRRAAARRFRSSSSSRTVSIRRRSIR